MDLWTLWLRSVEDGVIPSRGFLSIRTVYTSCNWYVCTFILQKVGIISGYEPTTQHTWTWIIHANFLHNIYTVVRCVHSLLSYAFPLAELKLLPPYPPIFWLPSCICSQHLWIIVFYPRWARGGLGLCIWILSRVVHLQALWEASGFVFNQVKQQGVFANTLVK